MSTWQLSTDNGASWTDCDAAGVDELSFRFRASGVGEAGFTIPSAQALTVAEPYAHGDTLIFRYGTTRRFYGRVISLPRQGGANERAHYRLADPWWYFEQITYMQSWRIYNTAGEALEDVNKSRVILFQDAAGDRVTVGAQIGDVVDWAIAAGAPLQKGVIDTGIGLPFDERDNLSCADALDTCLRWVPDWVAWVDPSTTPYPTFHCRKRANLSAASVALADAEGISITPRYDKQVPGVHITYEKTHTVESGGDSHIYNTVETDTAGNTSAFNTVFAAFELEGSSASYLTQKILTETFPEDLTDKTFWKAHLQALSDIADGDITIHDASRTQTELPRILLEGAVQSWMSKDAETCVVSAQADYVVRDASNNVLHSIKNEPVRIEVTATDASTHTYTRLSSYETAETTPTGVAAELYDNWSALHHEGRFVLHTEECAGTIRPGHTLNITAGLAAWATMAALVQSVDEEVENGRTTVVFGPPAQLEADTLVALFRALRSRRISWRRVTRSTGHRDGQAVALSGLTPSRSAHAGSGASRRLKVENEVGETTHDIDLDPTAVAFDDAGDTAAQDIKPRELRVPEVNASSQLVYKLRQVLASEGYHAEQLVGALIRLSELLDVDVSGTGNGAVVADGDVLIWDATNEEWLPGEAGSGLPDGSAEGDLLQWQDDGAGGYHWVAVDPTDLIKYNTSSKQLQVSKDGGTNWTMITGGQAVAMPT